MTNKEAIAILKPLFEQCKGTNECLGYIEHYFSKDEELALDLAIQALEERPQGEWEVIWHKDIYGRWSNYYEYKCSVCHNSYNDYSSGRKTAFCQFCGARMKGGA